jgi:hypothetical protein
MPKSKSLADRVRDEVRKAEGRGVTAYRLCKLSGVNDGTLCRFMRRSQGAKDPRASTLEKLAAAMGFRIVLQKHLKS